MKNSKTDTKPQLEIKEYLKQDLDSLYEILAGNFYDKGDLASRGKKIVEGMDQKLYQKICNEMEYCKNKSQYNYFDTKSLAGLLVNNLDELTHNHSNIPKPLLSVILIKIGLSKFCKC